MTQKDIYEALLKNPLNVEVHIGDLEDLNGKDYIFLDFTTDDIMPSDDKGAYQTFIQITCATKNWKDRKTLVKFIKELFNVSITYETSSSFQYYLARCSFGCLLYE